MNQDSMTDTIVGLIVGLMFGAGTAISGYAAYMGVDRETTYVCAPLVSGEKVGHTITTEDGVTHNCKHV